MNILIGIISYLPDTDFREDRFNCLQTLIKTCNYLFNLPIYIIIQNYKQDEIDTLLKIKNVNLSYNNERLGILGARRQLREYFINSNYTNLIMLDDDCVIKGSVMSACDYIKQIRENSDCFIEFNGTLLKLFEISKEIFSQVDYEEVNPEKEEGFEDIVFVSKLREMFKDKRKQFIKKDLEEYSISSKDTKSTWYFNQNIDVMREKTKNFKKSC